MLWQIAFLITGISCLAYYGALCIGLGKWNSTFSRFWPACGLFCLFCRYLYTDSARIPDLCRRLTSAAVVVLLLLFAVTELQIIRGMFPREYREYPYLIVLGAQVDGKKVTDSLRRRLDRAIRYLHAHPETKVIVSGGMGKQETVPEAEAMADYLLSHGIEEEKILREGRSRTTKENLRFSKAYIDDIGLPVGIVTNNFHIYRAVCYAKKEGYQAPYPVAADCRLLLLPNYMVREFFAVWKYYLAGCSKDSSV